MDRNPGKFRYPLQALLLKQSWDVSKLAAELASARQALAQHEGELAALRQTADEVNRSLAGLRADGAMLDLARQRRLVDYRDAQDEAIAAKDAQRGSAHDLCEQIGEQLARARLALDGYETHSDRLRHAHDFEAARVVAREADDAWLMRRLGEEAAR